MEDILSKERKEKEELELLVDSNNIDLTISLLNEKLVYFSNEHNLNRLKELIKHKQVSNNKRDIERIKNNISNFNNNFFNSEVIRNNFIKIIEKIIKGQKIEDHNTVAFYQQNIIQAIIKIKVRDNENTMEDNFRNLMDHGIGTPPTSFLKNIIKKAFKETIIDVTKVNKKEEADDAAAAKERQEEEETKKAAEAKRARVEEERRRQEEEETRKAAEAKRARVEEERRRQEE